MASAYKILGQSKPTAATDTALLTVGSGKSIVCSTLGIVNIGTGVDSIDIRVKVAGAANTDAQYLYKSLALNPNESIAITTGITLAATDVLQIKSILGTSCFNLFGTEIS